MTITADEQLRILLDGTVQVLPAQEFHAAIRAVVAGQRAPLRVKFGVDPTKPDLHLGHAVPLRKLRQFQQLGHTAVLVIGGFTAQLGDPSGRSTARPMLTAAEVEANAATYLAQVGRVLLAERLEITNNTDWLGAGRFADLAELTNKVTVAQILSREDFAARLQAGRPLALSELLYPLLQAQDSVEIRADVELGGTDQTFNLLMGREVQLAAGQRPQTVITLPLLTGLDGVEKMSKSAGNYVAFDDPPRAMLAKLLGVPPALLEDYLRLATDLHPDQTDRIATELAAGTLTTPQAARRLAWEVVALYHGEAAATAADREVFPLDAPAH